MRHTVETSAVDLFTLIEEKLSPVNAKRETGSDRLLVLRVAPDQLIASLKLLTEELGLKHLSTITGLDIGDAIELNYQFWHSDRIVDIKTSISKTDPRIEKTQQNKNAPPARRRGASSLKGGGFMTCSA